MWGQVMTDKQLLDMAEKTEYMDEYMSEERAVMDGYTPIMNNEKSTGYCYKETPNGISFVKIVGFC